MSIQSRISEILAAEAAAIAAVRVTRAFEQAVLTLRDSTGKVLTTGMGKAGHVARKFASTLCSTGTLAYYLHPGEAAHGDLGIVEPDDCVVAFSTSGKTREVIDMLERGRALGIRTIICITSHPESELRDLSDIVVDMGVIAEPWAHGLTPSASIAVMLAISDALALVLMDLKQFSRAEFGRRHHGGYLGVQSRADPEE
jgi:arabinose-5-phosphate isomerase